jgi:Holliday junction DNA helicase RuvA
MISFLIGEKIEIIKTINNRFILILNVNNIGYELQLSSRYARQLELETTKNIKVFTHLQIKEDQQVLYGFFSAPERDLFRQLISVSGIGAQLAIALLDTLDIEQLVQAIVIGNIRLLSKTPGVGQKTAERISLELRTKLGQYRSVVGMTDHQAKTMPSLAILEDLDMTLLALGYTNDEIQQAVSVLSQDNLMLKNNNVEEWIREAIAYLSQG